MLCCVLEAANRLVLVFSIRHTAILFGMLCMQVTDDGDVLYIFPGFAGGDKARKGRASKGRTVEEFEADQRSERGDTGFTATPEVLQFEVPHDIVLPVYMHYTYIQHTLCFDDRDVFKTF